MWKPGLHCSQQAASDNREILLERNDVIYAGIALCMDMGPVKIGNVLAALLPYVGPEVKAVADKRQDWHPVASNNQAPAM